MILEGSSSVDDLLEAEVERRSGHNADLERLYADDGFPAWTRYVYTEWEEAPGRTEIAQYPQFDFLTKYRETYQHAPYSVCDKSRAMLASTDPLLWDLWQCQRTAYHNTRHNAGRAPWRGAVQRQSQTDSISLLKRAYEVYSRLPDWLRMPLARDNQDVMETASGGIIRAFHSGAVAGRGDGWDHLNLDEFAYQMRAQENWQAFDRVRLKQAVSTPNGRGNPFEQLVSGVIPGVAHVRLHYSEHPARRPGTATGDAWIARKRAGKTEAEWQVEYEINYDVYLVAGYYGSDYTAAVVRPVEWDGKGIITIGMDYSYLHPAAQVAYANKYSQWCRIATYLQAETTLERFAAAVFGDCVRRYTGAAFRVAPDPFRGRQTKGDSDAFGDPATDLATVTRIAREILGPNTLVSIYQTGKMLRAEGHRRVRRGFVMREDGRYGTIIDPSCTLLVQGFAGAYGPSENATAHQLELEEPDPNRLHVHVMDADRYGFCEFVTADRGLDHVGVARHAGPVEPSGVSAGFLAGLSDRFGG